MENNKDLVGIQGLEKVHAKFVFALLQNRARKSEQLFRSEQRVGSDIYKGPT